MPDLSNLDLTMVTFRGRLLGQRVINTFAYNAINVQPNTTLQAAYTALLAQMKGVNNLLADYMECVPSNYLMEEVWFQVISPFRLAAIRFQENAEGQNQSAARTANLAGTITRRGDAASRPNVGSLHVPAPTTDAVITNGYFTPTHLTALKNLADELPKIITVGGADWIPVLVTPNQAQGARVTQAFPQQTVRVMRRRTVGVGE